MYATETKAKKEHLCNFCGGRIVIGELYEKSTHKDNGNVYDWKAHKNCSKLASVLNMYEDADDGVSEDMFIDCVSEKHDDILIAQLPQDELKKYSEIIQQLRRVAWKHKLSFVIRHLIIK